MIAEFSHYNYKDDGENPDGGVAFGDGFVIAWQKGPLGEGVDREEPNGAFVETIIAAAKERIEFYQNSKFKCGENELAILHLRMALRVLEERTSRRVEEGHEGTHRGN